MAKHYIITDEAGRILRGFSDDFETPGINAICVCENGGRHFEINGVTNPSMTNDHGVPLYKLVQGNVVVRTNEELNTDKPKEVLPISIEERTAALEAALLELIIGGTI